MFLQTATTSLERAIYAQTLSNTGTATVINILRPYVNGERDKNTIVRIAAMNGLSSKRLPQESKSQVFIFNDFIKRFIIITFK